MGNGDPRPEDDLREGALHVAYEVSMLHMSTSRAVQAVGRVSSRRAEDRGLTTSPVYVTTLAFTSGEDEFLANLLVESALLHARNVSEFLFPRASRKSDDIAASDYEPLWDGTPEGILIDGQAVDLLRKRIDKHLSHLTYERIADPDPRWAASISRDLLSQFERFYKMLPGERREWFGPALPISSVDNESYVSDFDLR